MDRYNPDGKCIKCGSGDIKDEHKEALMDFALPMPIKDGEGKYLSKANCPERIVRTCKGCGFTWDEATLDTLDVEMTAAELAGSKVKLGFHNHYDPNPTSFKASDIGQLEIGVGDEVHGRCDHTTCKVIGIDPVDKTCALQCTEMPWCVCDSNDANNDTPLHLKDLTLISKGPSKRHVEIVIADGCSALPMGIYTGSVELKGEDSQ